MPQALIYLDDELASKLNKIAANLEISKADLIIKILKLYKEEDGTGLRISS